MNTLTYNEIVLFKHAYSILDTLDFLSDYDPYFDSKLNDLLSYLEHRYKVFED